MCIRYRLNIWDVGGQKTLRSYWRNYYEQTDALIWVVDTTDLHRLEDCRAELHNLLKEERLTGATLLIFANKQDLAGSLPATQLQKVRNLTTSSMPSISWHILPITDTLVQTQHFFMLIENALSGYA